MKVASRPGPATSDRGGASSRPGKLLARVQHSTPSVEEFVAVPLLVACLVGLILCLVEGVDGVNQGRDASSGEAAVGGCLNVQSKTFGNSRRSPPVILEPLEVEFAALTMTAPLSSDFRVKLQASPSRRTLSRWPFVGLLVVEERRVDVAREVGLCLSDCFLSSVVATAQRPDRRTSSYAAR